MSALVSGWPGTIATSPEGSGAVATSSRSSRRSRLPLVPVGTVAGVAVVGQDRAHVPVEGDARTVGAPARPRAAATAAGGGAGAAAPRGPPSRSGQGAPSSIHRRTVSIWRGRRADRRRRGIRFVGIALHQELVEQAALRRRRGTTTAPGLAALEQALRGVEPETRPPSFRAPWQRTQEAARMGWTSRAKSTAGPDAVAGPRAEARAPPRLATRTVAAAGPRRRMVLIPISGQRRLPRNRALVRPCQRAELDAAAVAA